MVALDFQHLRYRESGVLRVHRFRPHGPATVCQPRIQFDKRTKPLFAGLNPNAPAAVLHILLDNAFLPARGHVAEVRIEQVMAAHGRKASINHALFALLDLVDSGLHVVVDAAPTVRTMRFHRPMHTLPIL